MMVYIPHIMGYEFKTDPYKHQAEILAKCWNKKNWAWLMEMGTGKSKVCIDNAAILFEKKEIDTLIVIAPKGVYRNWANIEIPAHLPDRIEKNVVTWSSSKTKANEATLKDFLTPTEAFRVFLMNVEALSTTKGKKYLETLLGRSKSLLAIDESTSIKSPKAKRTKTIIKLGPGAEYRRILTGFPVTQSPLDLWAQCNFLDKSLLGDCGDNFFQFQYRYSVMKKRNMGSHSFNLVVGYKNLEQLSELLKKFSSRVTKSECLDLPEKVYMQRSVALSPCQTRIYNEIKEFALAHLDNDGFMTAPNVMTQLLRMQQVLSGYTKTDHGELVRLDDNRLSELLSCLEETKGKSIIWSRFRYDVKRIKDALIEKYGPESTVDYFGDTSDEDRISAVEKFQDGEAKFFIGNPQTGGYGLTLTAAQNVIYYANSFDLAVRMQSEDRAHRIGQRNTVTYIDLISEGTIDEKIVKSLRSKMDIASQVMGEELRNWLT
jgi:SNF2 family DNA or RNA helicase